MTELYEFQYDYDAVGDYYTGTVADDGTYGYEVGDTWVGDSGEYTILDDLGGTDQAAGTVDVQEYYESASGDTYVTDSQADPEEYSGYDGLGSESDSITADDGTSYAFDANDWVPDLTGESQSVVAADDHHLAA